MKNIVVTGGAGFIGSHLVEHLVKRGDRVTVVDTLLRGNKLKKEILKEVDFRKEDVRDKEAMLKMGKNIDYIFHFAAILGVEVVAETPVETMETEVLGLKNIAESAMKNDIPKIVYASTSGVYGQSAIEKSVTEEIMIDPKTSYAMAKRFNEIYLAALFEEKGINGIALRFFNVYGERQDNRMVVPRFIEQALKGDDVSVYGTGNQTRDFTWIEDTVKSSVSVGDTIDGFQIFNVSNESEITIGEVAKKIISLTGSKSEIKYTTPPPNRYDYEVDRRVGNSFKLFNAIGYKPETDIDYGLSKMVQYFING